MCLRWIPFIEGQFLHKENKHIELFALLVSFLLLTTMATVNMTKCFVYVLPIRGRLMSRHSECNDDDFSPFTFGLELRRTSTMQKHRYKNTDFTWYFVTVFPLLTYFFFHFLFFSTHCFILYLRYLRFTILILILILSKLPYSLVQFACSKMNKINFRSKDTCMVAVTVCMLTCRPSAFSNKNNNNNITHNIE